MFTPRSARSRQALLVATTLAALVLASFALAQQLDPGDSSPRTAPAASSLSFDTHTRTVAMPVSELEVTSQLLEAFALCSASSVGCTITFSPGVYTVRGLDLHHFTGTLRVDGGALVLAGHFAPRPTVYRRVATWLDTAPYRATTVGISF
jgi:hypothetical protein